MNSDFTVELKELDAREQACQVELKKIQARRVAIDKQIKTNAKEKAIDDLIRWVSPILTIQSNDRHTKHAVAGMLHDLLLNPNREFSFDGHLLNVKVKRPDHTKTFTYHIGYENSPVSAESKLETLELDNEVDEESRDDYYLSYNFLGGQSAASLFSSLQGNFRVTAMPAILAVRHTRDEGPLPTVQLKLVKLEKKKN